MSLLLLFGGAGVQAPWQASLLATARRLASEGQSEVAIVTAMMACEVQVERAFAFLFAKRGVSDLEEAVTSFFPSYSLSNDRVRSMYVALSGDSIQDVAFWSRYKESAATRNRVVHKGERATPDQAAAACEVADLFVSHISSKVK